MRPRSMDGQREGCVNRSVDGSMGGLKDRSIHGSMDGWMAAGIDARGFARGRFKKIDGLRAPGDRCMPVGPTVFKLDFQIPSAIVRSRAAATTFSNIGQGVCIRLCGACYKLGKVTSSTSFHILSGTMAAGSG